MKRIKKELFNKIASNVSTAARSGILETTFFNNNCLTGVSDMKYARVFNVRGEYNMSTNLFVKKKQNYYKSLFGVTKVWFRFVGKSYRVRFKKNIIFLRFHRSHITTLLYKNYRIRFIKNRGFVLRNWYTSTKLMLFKKRIYNVRKRNFFTKRGIWYRDEMYYKKKGKISGYR